VARDRDGVGGLGEALQDDRRMKRRGPPAARVGTDPGASSAVPTRGSPTAPPAPGGRLDPAPLPESDYELPILRAYEGERREGGRPIQNSVRALMKPNLPEADRAPAPGGEELWSARLLKRRRELIDRGLVSFDPRRRVWGLTGPGEARWRELERARRDEERAAPGPDAGEEQEGSDR
jgi:hypothetical protein